MPSTHAPDPSLTAPIAEIERELSRWIEDAGAGGDRSAALRDAMAYAALGGGKRLRPLLAWHCAVAAGGNGRQALAAGAAVEFVHAFSLVHDDLPAMDDDDLRRGRPTLHVHAGEAMAILAGDALLALAFDAIARAEAPAGTTARLVRELSHGTAGMITGQVLDTMPDREPGFDRIDPLTRLQRVHRNKTGALIRAACRMGAVAVAAPEDAVEIAGRYGEAIGLMFQAVDDLIDVEQPAEHAGKRTGKDKDAGKLTYPGVLGVDRTRETITALEAEARQHAERLPGDHGPLLALASFMASRDR
ncbi:MAG: polyprenyl synthetase family protein [Phycisphaerales bacterium]